MRGHGRGLDGKHLFRAGARGEDREDPRAGADVEDGLPLEAGARGAQDGRGVGSRAGVVLEHVLLRLLLLVVVVVVGSEGSWGRRAGREEAWKEFRG